MTESNVGQDSKIKVSVLLWDCGFRERFHAIKSFLNQSLPSNEFEVLWVEHYDHVRREVTDFEEKYANFHVVTLNRHGQWHYGVCVNEGARLARGSILIISDGDVVVDEHFVSDTVNNHVGVSLLVNYYRRYDEQIEPKEYCDDIKYLRRSCVVMNPSNYAGCFSIERDKFIAVNGYEMDVAFCGPSACAKDAYVRFKNMGYLIRWDPEPRVFHPWHPGSAPMWIYLLSNQDRIIRKRDLDMSTYPNLGYSEKLNRDPVEFDRVEAVGLKQRAKELVRMGILRLLH